MLLAARLLSQLQGAATTEGGDGDHRWQWAATIAAEPVRTRILFHFGSERETARVDKPEWLFAAAERFTKVRSAAAR